MNWGVRTISRQLAAGTSAREAGFTCSVGGLSIRARNRNQGAEQDAEHDEGQPQAEMADQGIGQRRDVDPGQAEAADHDAGDQAAVFRGRTT
jgi:hypothetical protein